MQTQRQFQFYFRSPRELEIMHPTIKVIFLSSNATALVQGIIQAFQLYDIRQPSYWTPWNLNFETAKCIVNFKESLQELKTYTIKHSGKNCGYRWFLIYRIECFNSKMNMRLKPTYRKCLTIISLKRKPQPALKKLKKKTI